MPNDKFAIYMLVTHKFPYLTFPSLTLKKKIRTNFFFFNMTSRFHSDDDFDVIIQIGKDHDTKKLHAHSAILQECSPYFKRAFSSSWIVKKDNTIIFNKPNITPIVFEIILK